LVRFFNVYYPVRTLILLCGEALIICFSFVVATLIRFGADSSLKLNYEGGMYKIALASVVCLLCLYYYDLYDSFIFSNPREVLTRIVQVLGAACLIMAIVYYALPVVRLEAGLFIPGILLIGICLAGWRKLFVLLNRSSRLASRALVLGVGPLAEALVPEIENRPEWGVRLVGYVGRALPTAAGKGIQRLGGVEDLAAVVDGECVDQIVITMGERRGALPVEALLRLKSQGVVIRDGAEVYETLTGKVFLESLKLSWLLFSRGFRVSRAMLVYKRATSVIFSSVGLLLALPFMAVIALAIRLDSKGPILFRQERVGLRGVTFKLNKFRSMVDGADADGIYRPVQENDERITRVGRWLRRARLDELPQLWNVLRGDMYFVGPRPFVPNQERECEEKIPFYIQRWSVRPGATGWAQVNREYCATVGDNVEKLAYDLFYIKNMSVGLDLLIMFKTMKILLLGRGGR
jgi:sugar transferase (PEP-CTERM system associated)